MRNMAIILLIFIALLCSSSIAETYLTKDELLEAAGLSENDVPGLDIEELIDMYALTKENIEEIGQEKLRTFLLSRVDEYSENVAYMFYADNVADWNWKDERIDDMLNVALVVLSDSYADEVLFDMKNGKMYFGDILYDLATCRTFDLTSQEMKKMLCSYNIEEWTEGKSDEITQYGLYTLAVEYVDGTIEQISLWNFDDAGREKMRSFKQDIFDIISEE